MTSSNRPASAASAVNDNGLAAKCPVCKAPATAAYKPFCTKRCADVDLHRWLAGGYAVPAEEPPDSDDIAAETPDEGGR